jgi:hypothetical protein
VALKSFQESAGWEVGANAKVTIIDQGKAGDINSVIASTPVVAFAFGLELMGDPGLQGAKITKLPS